MANNAQPNRPSNALFLPSLLRRERRAPIGFRASTRFQIWFHQAVLRRPVSCIHGMKRPRGDYGVFVALLAADLSPALFTDKMRYACFSPALTVLSVNWKSSSGATGVSP